MCPPVLNLPFTQQTQPNLQAWGSTPWAAQDKRGSSGEGTGPLGNPASALQPDAAYGLYQRGRGCAGKGRNCSEVGGGTMGETASARPGAGVGSREKSRPQTGRCRGNGTVHGF